ncbi:hypothetical protein [Legionella sainthelensi]|uniref:hypothetical protein n=1 Tax=Legionella sainthelensi TaxID=28087 RepID=UPI0018D52DA9|nr:hypothetical protein [Legionella sainthelensi]
MDYLKEVRYKYLQQGIKSNPSDIPRQTTSPYYFECGIVNTPEGTVTKLPKTQNEVFFRRFKGCQSVDLLKHGAPGDCR